jgi:hypothetical protein
MGKNKNFKGLPFFNQVLNFIDQRENANHGLFEFVKNNFILPVDKIAKIYKTVGK